MNTVTVRRLTWLLFASQSLTSAAVIAGTTIAAIVGAQLSGQPALAGLPSAIYLLGAALAAYPAARLMERWGRRPGLALGYCLGVVGALAAGYAILRGSFAGFLLGLAGMGVNRGFSDLGRYAAAEMHPVAQRARAISLVVLGGTVGAIGGPALVKPMGQVASSLNADALAGPWFASAGLFLLGLIVIGLFLRPDPRDLARRLAAEQPQAAAPAEPVRPWRVILAHPATQVAVSAMIIGQLVMVMLMTITSLHMTHNGHGLGDVSLVIMAHTLGMFGFSVVAGRLADNFGRAGTILAGGALLVAACILAPLSQATAVLALALFLLGLGWNFCYVAGAALLTDSLNLAERGRMQGTSDLVVGLISALGSLQSGAIFAAAGYANLAWISLAIALVPAWLALRLSRQGRRRTATELGLPL